MHFMIRTSGSKRGLQTADKRLTEWMEWRAAKTGQKENAAGGKRDRIESEWMGNRAEMAQDGTEAGKVMLISQITEEHEKKQLARGILEALSDWFGIPEAREEYIRESAGKDFFAAYQGEKPIGFLYLKETGKDTAELAVMGILKEYHRQGAGRMLFDVAKEAARKKGYSFLQVKTVQMGRYEEYDRTNAFYLALGFREFEVFPTLWDECNPCQVYVMAL